MPTITAIYENGVFRPTAPVTLPTGTLVQIELPSDELAFCPPSRMSPELAAVYEVLSRRHNSGHHDTAERHNEHRP